MIKSEWGGVAGNGLRLDWGRGWVGLSWGLEVQEMFRGDNGRVVVKRGRIRLG